MNKKTRVRIFIIAFCFLLALMSLPKKSTERLQGTVVAMLSPFWNSLLDARPSSEGNENGNLQKLQLENALLREEILHIKNVIQHELDLLNEMKSLVNSDENALSTKSLKKRHSYELQKLLKIALEIVPARIIYRSPSSWNSSVWINVGTDTNKDLGIETIARNSPVLVGTTVVGVIDYVGKRQARVRLITDPELTPSVRVSRPANEEGNQPLYLAKGEIRGSGKQLWRTQKRELIGVGFNYDFADDPARDLRTGRPDGSSLDTPSVAIVQAGDLLVTTGLDGIFPADLPVATVSKVYPLKEGDYYYELEAIPVVEDLDSLSLVFVIPPVGYNENE